MYNIIKTTIYDTVLGKYTTYGIRLAGTTKAIRDISCDKSFVEKVAALLNKHKVSAEHMQDIVDDLLAER